MQPSKSSALLHREDNSQLIFDGRVPNFNVYLTVFVAAAIIPRAGIYFFNIKFITKYMHMIAAPAKTCPPSSETPGYLFQYGDKCYQFILTEKTWIEARSYCYSKGAALMNLENSR